MSISKLKKIGKAAYRTSAQIGNKGINAGKFEVKTGMKVVKFPIKTIKKFISKEEKVVTEIGIEDLKNLMIASAKKIVAHQEEINKINFWPVADKDTGYNLAATLLGIEGVISQREYKSIRWLSQDIKEAALANARGNVGMIYTGYLRQVLDTIKHLRTIDAFHLALALKKGIKGGWQSIHHPMEGTILDVIKASGDTCYQNAKLKKEKNIIKILDEAYKTSQIALKETTEKIDILKKHHVVDAGALGFVKILEAWIESLRGEKVEESVERPSEKLIAFDSEPEIQSEHQHELIFTLKRKPAKSLDKLKTELTLLGASLDILETEDKIKIHIHTNFPEKIREKIKDFEILEWQLEDMIPKVAKPIQRKPLGLIVIETADLPKEFLREYHIEEIPCEVLLEGREIPLKGQALFKMMREAERAGKPLPTTSQPTYGNFLSAYKTGLEKFEKILVITLSSKLSGTYSSARVARSIFKKPQKSNIFIFDCGLAEVGEGLVGMRTQELILQGKTVNNILNQLKQFCPQVRLLGALESFKYVAQTKRFPLPTLFVNLISLLQKLGIRPLITLKEGKVKFHGVRFGKNLAKILAKEIDRQREDKETRVAISHADNLKVAEVLKEELEKRSKVKVLYISSVSPVVGVHTGPGAVLVSFYSV